MTRDWAIASTLEAIQKRMLRFGENCAPIPIAVTLEVSDEVVVWVVDLHIKVRYVTEFDITAEGPSLSAALRRAYLGMNNPNGLQAKARKANELYGIPI